MLAKLEGFSISSRVNIWKVDCILLLNKNAANTQGYNHHNSLEEVVAWKTSGRFFFGVECFFFVSKKTDDWNLFFVGVSLVIFWQGSSPNSSWVGSFLSGGDAWHAVEWDFWTRKKSDSKYLTPFWKP